MKDYKEMSSRETVEELNKLGYLCAEEDNYYHGIFGLIVSIAKELEKVKNQITILKDGKR